MKGAFEAVAKVAEVPTDARRLVDDLAGRGHRVIAVAMGTPPIAPARRPHRHQRPAARGLGKLIATLNDMKVRTVMVTGDSAVTAAAIARKVGIAGEVCPPERFPTA